MHLIEKAECSSCGKTFKAIMPDDTHEYYFCENIACKIKVVVEYRSENPIAYGITIKQLRHHYGDNWYRILTGVVD